MVKSYESSFFAITVAVLRTTSQPAHGLESTRHLCSEPQSRQFSAYEVWSDIRVHHNGSIREYLEELFHVKLIVALRGICDDRLNIYALSVFLLVHLHLSLSGCEFADAHLVIGAGFATLVVGGESESL